MTTWKITKSEDMLLLNAPNWLGDPESWLCEHNEHGEAVVPSEWGEEALSCLYGEYQCNDHLEDGDEFEYEGRIVARCEGVHVLEVPHA
jgi:hypothetical protein